MHNGRYNMAWVCELCLFISHSPLSNQYKWYSPAGKKRQHFLSICAAGYTHHKHKVPSSSSSSSSVWHFTPFPGWWKKTCFHLSSFFVIWMTFITLFIDLISTPQLETFGLFFQAETHRRMQWNARCGPQLPLSHNNTNRLTFTSSFVLSNCKQQQQFFMCFFIQLSSHKGSFTTARNKD